MEGVCFSVEHPHQLGVVASSFEPERVHVPVALHPVVGGQEGDQHGYVAGEHVVDVPPVFSAAHMVDPDLCRRGPPVGFQTCWPPNVPVGFDEPNEPG